MNQYLANEGLPHEILEPDFDLKGAVIKTVEQGYCFASSVITEEACAAMEDEAEGKGFQPSTQLINDGTSRQVTQSHERAYLPICDDEVPVAALVTRALMRRIQALDAIYPELADWRPTEAGYQRYRSSDDGISPHRDRESDQLLAVTITLNGSAPVRIYKPLGGPYDYSNLRLTDEFKTERGSVMLLKAPGLGDSQRTIHEAVPPSYGSRLILNLRMRPDVLKTNLDN